jgi:hypothetical protein
MRLTIFIISLLSLNLLHATKLSNHVREEKSNMLGVFMGGTNTQHKNFFTYGFEYHRIIALPIGLSLIGEHVAHNIEAHHEVDLVGLLTFNLLNNITLGFGPGLELEERKPTRLLGRISASYIFLFHKDIEIAPGIDYNFIQQEHNQLIYGITLGKKF